MARKPTGAKTGRPPIDIDEKVVEGMASIGATNIEIADFFDCSPDTIERRFAGLLTKSRAGMRIRLRRLQMQAAAAGDKTMLVWLGKQVLGQQDKQTHEHAGEGGGPLEVVVTRRIIDPAVKK